MTSKATEVTAPDIRFLAPVLLGHLEFGHGVSAILSNIILKEFLIQNGEVLANLTFYVAAFFCSGFTMGFCCKHRVLFLDVD